MIRSNSGLIVKAMDSRAEGTDDGDGLPDDHGSGISSRAATSAA